MPQNPDQINAQAKAEGPHSNAGSNHGKLQLCCTHAVSRINANIHTIGFTMQIQNIIFRTHFGALASIPPIGIMVIGRAGIYHCTADDQKTSEKAISFFYNKLSVFLPAPRL